MAGPYLTILSHNAGWFQGWPYAPDVPDAPVPTVVDTLAALYARINPDVLSLQEVQSQEAFRFVERAMNLCGTYCAGMEKPAYGGAILWREGRAGTDARIESAAVLRFWQTADIPLLRGIPLTVCNLHLSSSRHLPESQAAQTRRNDLNQLFGRCRPHVICGDFNEGPPGGPSELLSEKGYLDTAHLISEPPVSTGVNKARSDQIWIDRSLEPAFEELGYLTWEELAYAAPGKNTLSDHLPLWLRLNRQNLADLLERADAANGDG